MWCRLLDRSQTDYQQTQPLRIKPAMWPQDKQAPKRLDISKLKKGIYFISLDAIQLSSQDPEVFRTFFSNVHTTFCCLSQTYTSQTPRLDKEIQCILEGKHRLNKLYQSDTSSVPQKGSLQQHLQGSPTCNNLG